MLDLTVLPLNTRKVFDALAAEPLMKGWTLIGGTALALYLRHRVSEDLDFAVFTPELPTHRIDQLIGKLKSQGNTVQLITDPGMISRFKINTGEDLLCYARDYAINGVKVTFFAHGRTDQQKKFFDHCSKVSVGAGFDVLSLEGLKVAKTLVLGDRVMSRDLFDILFLLKHSDYTLDAAFNTIKELGVNNDPEYYKSVMTGVIPLDVNDPGLAPVGVKMTIQQIIEELRSLVNSYEQHLAAKTFSNTPQP